MQASVLVDPCETIPVTFHKNTTIYVNKINFKISIENVDNFVSTSRY